MKNLLYILASWILVFSSCEEPPKPKQQRVVTKKEMIDYNRKSVRMESDQIDSYIKRRGWEMTETGSGLRYMVYEKAIGNNAKPAENQHVEVSYTVSLINGKEIYQSDPNEPAEFVVGHDDVESGLQEGICFLGVGDKAMLIIPSHLAHGYTGDFDKIPHNATVIFDIELLKIK